MQSLACRAQMSVLRPDSDAEGAKLTHSQAASLQDRAYSAAVELTAVRTPHGHSPTRAASAGETGGKEKKDRTSTALPLGRPGDPQPPRSTYETA